MNNNNPITKYPEGLYYLEKNMGTILFFPRLKLLKGLRLKSQEPHPDSCKAVIPDCKSLLS